MPGWNFLSWKGLAHLMRAGKSDLSRQGEKLWWRGKRADPSGSEKLSCQIDVGDTSPRLETSCAVPVPSLAWLETARQPSWRGQSDGRSSFLVSMHTFPEDSSSLFCYGLGLLVYQLLFGFWFDFCQIPIVCRVYEKNQLAAFRCRHKHDFCGCCAISSRAKEKPPSELLVLLLDGFYF